MPLAFVRLPVTAGTMALRLLGRRPPRAAAVLDKYLEDVIVSSQKIERAIGFVARHDVNAGRVLAVRDMNLGNARK